METANVRDRIVNQIQHMVSRAASELDRDRYLALIRSAPAQLQATMAACICACRKAKGGLVGTGEAYDAYKAFCRQAGLRSLTGRAFGDLLAELDMYSLIRSRVQSRGRYGRTRQIVVDMSGGLTQKIQTAILLNFDLAQHSAGDCAAAQ